MLDKYSRIQDIVDQQKKKYEKILEIFERIFVGELKLEKVPIIEVEFGNEKTTNLVKIKILDKSSIKFIVKQNEKKLLEIFKKEFPKDIFKIY